MFSMPTYKYEIYHSLRQTDYEEIDLTSDDKAYKVAYNIRYLNNF